MYIVIVIFDFFLRIRFIMNLKGLYTLANVKPFVKCISFLLLTISNTMFLFLRIVKSYYVFTIIGTRHILRHNNTMGYANIPL